MATYVVSPSTQSGVDNTRTHITRSFAFYAGGRVEVDYVVSSEADFDYFRIYYNSSSAQFTASGEASGTATINTATGGSLTLRLEYEKDGGVAEGSDNCSVSEIRIYNSSSVLQETHNFSGTAGNTPTGWTQVLNDGGTAVVGSNWALVDTGGGGTTLTPSLFTNSQSFPAPSVSRDVAPALFTSSNSFFAPTVALDVAPGLFTNGQTFYAPTVSEGAADTALTPALFTNSQTFYGPTATLDLTPALLSNAQSFFAPEMSLGLTPSLLSEGQAFYSPTLTLELLPGLHTNSSAFYSPTVAGVAGEPGNATDFVLTADSRHTVAVGASEHRVEVNASGTRVLVAPSGHAVSVSSSRHIAIIYGS